MSNATFSEHLIKARYAGNATDPRRAGRGKSPKGLALRTVGRILFATLLAGIIAVLSAGPSSAEPVNPTTPSGIADFQGTKIDLSKGWGNAKSCAVYSQSDIRCHSSYAEANAATGHVADDVSPLGTANCPGGWVCIYQYEEWDGRRLQFQDEKWMSLEPFGFPRDASSWHNNQDCAWYQDKNDNGTLGNGAGRNLDMPACSRASRMGSYNNVAVDIHG